MSESEVCHDRGSLPDTEIHKNPNIDTMLKLNDANKCQEISDILVNEYGRKFISVSPNPHNNCKTIHI